MTTSTDLLQSVATIGELVNEHLERWLPSETTAPERLHEAMRYAVFAGGKRVRPVLALMVCRALGGRDEDILPAACALECIHTYSLVHDDLPAMDDDDLRRGRPTVHIAYDEGLAILAGDALLTYAFELIVKETPDHALAGQLVGELAHLAGAAGMVGGQALDMESEKLQNADETRLETIHTMKTAGLITAACTMGALASGTNAENVEKLRLFGHELGLAFQIADDILDETGSAEDLGKTPGKDREAGKLTYPALIGLDASREKARARADRAKEAIAFLGVPAEPLIALSDYIVERTH